MTKKLWMTTGVVLVLVVLFGGLFGGRWLHDRRVAQTTAAQGGFSAAVATALARQATWDPSVQVVGSLAAIDGTEITAQIAGNVTEIAFAAGKPIKAGALLVHLDDSTQLAQLHNDEARLKLAHVNLQRAQELASSNFISKVDLDQASLAAEQAEAVVEQDRAVLRKLRITAPFDGVVGVQEISLGQYVAPGTAIVNLQRHNPLFLNFSLPQADLPRLGTADRVSFTVDAYPGRMFSARVTALGSGVDPSTRNVKVQATVDNPDGALRPGLYGQVSLNIGKPLAGVEIPDTAVAYSTFGNIVYVVEPADGGRQIAHARVVKVADERDGRVLLASGVADGDTVVVAGANKLFDGAAITVGTAPATAGR